MSFSFSATSLRPPPASSTSSSAHICRPNGLPPPQTVLLRTYSSSFLPRRRRLRRNHRRISTNPLRPYVPSSPSSTDNDDVDVSISLDVDETISKASASLRRFYRNLLASGADAYDDLRSSIRVDYESWRIGFSCRRSSLVFVANALFGCVVAVAAARVVYWLYGMFFRWSWRAGGFRSLVKRDRSLGGREVVVGRRSSTSRELEMWVNPLSLKRSTETKRRDGVVRRKQRSRKERVPEWWPTKVSSQSPSNYPSYVGMEDSKREAAMLVRAMMDGRLNGRDFQEDDIIQFRQICRSSDVRVHFETANARDSFFRASITFALNICSRAGQSVTSVQIDGEEIRQFLAGLAYNIGLEDTRAAVLISAEVAARTRSCFLQALALEIQGKRTDALEELSKISHIHRAFPPEDKSPEMEMVACGLQKSLKLEQREHLLNLIKKVSDAERQRIAAAALGLQALSENSDDKAWR